jgi:hypothetical protein
MANNQKFERPAFDKALTAWKDLLSQRGLAADCIWIFDENLCFEPDAAAAGAFKVGYQTTFTPPPEEAAQIAYEEFADSSARLVFYRLGSARGKSVCLVLCDPWFEAKGESEGFVRRDEWLMSFRPGGRDEIPEITDENRWRNRVLRDRPLHDLDFCMSLRAIHEIMAHGRVLTSYERYALRFLHAWRRLLGQADRAEG